MLSQSLSTFTSDKVIQVLVSTIQRNSRSIFHQQEELSIPKLKEVLLIRKRWRLQWTNLLQEIMKITMDLMLSGGRLTSEHETSVTIVLRKLFRSICIILTLSQKSTETRNQACSITKYRGCLMCLSRQRMKSLSQGLMLSLEVKSTLKLMTIGSECLLDLWNRLILYLDQECMKFKIPSTQFMSPLK